MNHYEFGYDQGTHQITCKKNNADLNWTPPVHGLGAMAGLAKRVFYADLVKDMQARPSVINSVGVITTNFAGHLPVDVNTTGIKGIRIDPLEALKTTMKGQMTSQGTYVEKPNIPKSSTSSVAPKKYSLVDFVYYDSGESPSDICLKPNVTHLVDPAYCLDPASGTSHTPWDPVKCSFTANTTLTEGLFGFPSYYSFTTRPADPADPANPICQVRYTLNPIVPGTPNNLDVAVDLDVGKNTAFNSQYSNAVKNVFITRNPGRTDEIIKKLVIKESGDCAQMWSILCRNVIEIEESMPTASSDEKEAEFRKLRENILLITTDSVVFSRGIPFCNVSNNGGREGVVSGCFTQQYFTHGVADYPKAYETDMNLEKDRIIGENSVIIGIFENMKIFFRPQSRSFPYFYRLIDTPGDRRPKKELLYNTKLYDPTCIEGLCQAHIALIAGINAALTAQVAHMITNKPVVEIESPDLLATALKDDFHAISGRAYHMCFSRDPNGNYMVQIDALHTEIEGCLLTPRQLKAASNIVSADAPGDDEPDPGVVAAVQDALAYFSNEANYDVDVFRDFTCYKDETIVIDVGIHLEGEEDEEGNWIVNKAVIEEEEEDANFSYYECLVAYMILQNGVGANSPYAFRSDNDGRIYISRDGFLKEYDTFIDEYKREAAQGEPDTYDPDGNQKPRPDEPRPRHIDVQQFIKRMATEGAEKGGGDEVRQIGARCLREIINPYDFLDRKYIYKGKLVTLLQEGISEENAKISAEVGTEIEFPELIAANEAQGFDDGGDDFDDEGDKLAVREGAVVEDSHNRSSDEEDLELLRQLQNVPSVNNYSGVTDSPPPNLVLRHGYDQRYSSTDVTPDLSQSSASSVFSTPNQTPGWTPDNSQSSYTNSSVSSSANTTPGNSQHWDFYSPHNQYPMNHRYEMNRRKQMRKWLRGPKRMTYTKQAVGLLNPGRSALSSKESQGRKGGKRRTMKVKKYLKNNHKKTIRNNKKTIRNNKKTIRNNRKKLIRKHKKTYKSKP